VAWATRSTARRHGVGKDTVARIRRARRLQPWRVDRFKLGADPDFEAAVRDAKERPPLERGPLKQRRRAGVSSA